ncbi:MAG: RHS repeat-associated core domain-containing protein, partial [Gammaproteobacteria bacterium]|nr:RHS repeat-associated core domain-containing protein [Gammaproteobacteria bacterium]
QFQYDPNGYRIRKTTGEQTQYYYLEGEHLEAIYDGDGRLTAQYLRGAVIDEVVNGYQKDGNNKLVNTTYHHDALQSVLGQSGHEGSVLTAQSYGAFGNVLSQTGPGNNRLKYTGREEDSTGLYYYRARYYDPFIGRFISEDPLGFNAGDVNFYVYVGNNPVNNNDPTGNICVPCVAALPPLLNAVGIGAATSMATGAAIRGISGNEVLDSRAIFFDAGLGVLGAGLVHKGVQLYQARHIAAPLATKLAASSGSAAQAEITSGIYFFEQGGASYVGQSSQIGTRLAAHEANPIKPISSVDNAVRAAVNGSKASREVAEQLTLNNMGGINASGVLNAINPIGAARIGLFNNSSLGTITSIATPAQSVWNSLFTGSSIGLSTNISSGANGGFVLYPNKSNTNMMQSVYQK